MIYAFNAYDDMYSTVTPIGEGTKFNASNIQTVNFDIGTLALAFCYFERLVLYGVWINR